MTGKATARHQHLTIGDLGGDPHPSFPWEEEVLGCLFP
ncbi:hypothetical protein LARV_00666 [Longilinea arvoryzae]|uniref:Uncharacterized protein n=1 Tax=Longilinea arvoryzae TaxID=360412 RepID=A0A0S7BCD3_9CHLR|nr:hypothetical protein LARV_00665 [Longilinea arvoryzae]GAP12926.1 hypothetical protein LARV_00666 [Longilinea arvoryzae]